MIVLLSSDLLFASRFHAAAEDAGIASQGALSTAQVMSAVQRGDVTGVCVDLEAPALDIAALIPELKGCGPIAVVAYGPHVQEQRLAAAQQAGADAVLSRGQFDRSLPQVVRMLAGAT